MSGFGDSVTYDIDSIEGFIKGVKLYDSDMDIQEAIAIVLELARAGEEDEDFEWLPEHSEACGVVDTLTEMFERGEK